MINNKEDARRRRNIKRVRGSKGRRGNAAKDSLCVINGAVVSDGENGEAARRTLYCESVNRLMSRDVD